MAPPLALGRSRDALFWLTCQMVAPSVLEP